MITILVAASADERDFSGALSRMLKKHFGGAQCPEFMLCDIASYNSKKTDKIIIVCKSPHIALSGLCNTTQAIAIVDSSSEELLRQVSDTRLPAITCGLRRMDTISLSSMTADSAVIDLRRSVTCLDGGKVEPQELPLRMPTLPDSFLLMSTAAILILCGKIDCLKEGFF